MTVKTDKKTLALIADIKKRKDELRKLDRPTWRTNCAFAFEEGPSSPMNIQVVNLRQLVEIVAFLHRKKLDYEEAGRVLGVENLPKFEWRGYSAEEWTEDVRLRISRIEIVAKKKQLETLEARLNSIISPELKAELELDAIQSELNG